MREIYLNEEILREYFVSLGAPIAPPRFSLYSKLNLRAGNSNEMIVTGIPLLISISIFSIPFGSIIHVFVSSFSEEVEGDRRWKGRWNHQWSHRRVACSDRLGILPSSSSFSSSQLAPSGACDGGMIYSFPIVSQRKVRKENAWRRH